jgi:uncharacterized protein YegL
LLKLRERGDHRRKNDKIRKIKQRNNQEMHTSPTLEVQLTASHETAQPDLPFLVQIRLTARCISTASTTSRYPVHVVIAYDTSGSTSRIQSQCQLAFRLLLDALQPTDRLTWLTFADQIMLVEKYTELSTCKERCLSRLAGIEAIGGTNLDRAIHEAILQVEPHHTGYTFVVLFTDGQPTSGDTNAKRIQHRAYEQWMQMVSQQTTTTSYLIALGFGNSVNVRLLDGLTRQLHGTFQSLSNAEQLAGELGALLAQINSIAFQRVQVRVRLDRNNSQEEAVELVYDARWRQLSDRSAQRQLVTDGESDVLVAKLHLQQTMRHRLIVDWKTYSPQPSCDWRTNGTAVLTIDVDANEKRVPTQYCSSIELVLLRVEVDVALYKARELADEKQFHESANLIDAMKEKTSKFEAEYQQSVNLSEALQEVKRSIELMEQAVRKPTLYDKEGSHSAYRGSRALAERKTTAQTIRGQEFSTVLAKRTHKNMEDD